MCARQPVAQQLRRLGRRSAVKRHQRSGHAGQPHDVGAPTVVRDWGDFDEIRASCDGFLKAMYVSGHVVRSICKLLGARGIVRTSRLQTSEALYESDRTQCCESKKYFQSRFVHRIFTIHPQDFHIHDLVS
jgi:hypothetical protein